MKDKKEKLVIPDAVRAWYSKCGTKGGSVTTEKKSAASRQNGIRPCKPGKFRGRPFKKAQE